MFSRQRKHLTPVFHGDEGDALFGPAPLCIYDQPGIRKKTKKRYNRRVRRLHKTEILNRGEE